MIKVEQNQAEGLFDSCGGCNGFRKLEIRTGLRENGAHVTGLCIGCAAILYTDLGDALASQAGSSSIAAIAENARAAQKVS